MDVRIGPLLTIVYRLLWAFKLTVLHERLLLLRFAPLGGGITCFKSAPGTC